MATSGRCKSTLKNRDCPTIITYKKDFDRNTFKLWPIDTAERINGDDDRHRDENLDGQNNIYRDDQHEKAETQK